MHGSVPVGVMRKGEVVESSNRAFAATFALP